MSQQFCLKWNNHTTNMLQVFENLLTTEALVDVTLACDGLSLKAHKMVLSACSPFFQSLFLENPCKHPIVIMKDMRYCDLKAIIDFMYRGEVNVSHDQLSALLKTAETLKVKGLAEVTGENRQASGMVQQEIVQQNTSTPTPVPIPIPPTAQRTDTPPLQGKRKRGRPRKRSLSDSNRSDDEGVPSKIKETNSDIEELSGDASMEAKSDNLSGGGPVSCNSQSQVPIHSSNNVNNFSKSHLSSSQDPQVEEPVSGDENEFEVEPSKLLEQTLTTENVPSNSQNSTGPITLPSVSGLEISRRSMSSTDSASQALVPVSIPSDSLGSNLQGPDSPQDVKPQILSFDDPPISPVAGTSHGSDRSLMMYMDQSGVASIPGPSNFQDNSALVPHDSQPQDGKSARSATIKSNAITHTCETSRLLSELQDNAVCMCELDETNFVEVSGEKTFSGEKNKQLIIYNEEGCMKGVEVGKCIAVGKCIEVGKTSDPASSPQDFEKPEDIFAIEGCEEDDIIDIAPERNKSSSFEQKSPLIGDLGTDLSGMPILLQQTYPQYTTKKPVGRPRRKKRGPKKGQTRKPKSKVVSPKVCLQRFQESDQHSLQRTYTQVSVEEVHVSKAVGRPRRNVRKKSASEMLMLKRRIVHSTSSYEYKPQKIRNQLNSNNDSGIFGHMQNSRLAAQTSGNQLVLASSYPMQTGSLANPTPGNQIVKHRGPTGREKYGPDLLPPGWDVQVVTRKTGKTAGTFDVYFVGPDGKRIRSRIQLASYLEEHGLPYSPDEFCFSKSFYRTADKM